MEPVTTLAAIGTLAALTSAVANLYTKGKALAKDAKHDFDDLVDAGNVSLPAYIKPLRLCSRVYIDDAVYSDPVMTDIIKSIHTQYAAFVLTALQMNRFVTREKTVQSMLRVIATEDNKLHESALESLFPWNKPADTNIMPAPTKDQVDAAASKKENETVRNAPSGKIIPLSGDGHVPAGKLLEITLTNPDDKSSNQTVTLMVQLAPYRVPTALAVQLITKDVIPSMYQRYLQWRTGEITFWRDFVAMSDIVNHREKLMKMDPTGILAEHIQQQTNKRGKVLSNIPRDKAERARNLANSVMIFSKESVQRAKAESGIDITDAQARQHYFATSFAMMLVVVDPLYNQVTFYYNGIDDAATFSFDQMQLSNKGGGGLDLVSVMNALGQGRSPKF